MQKRKNFRTNSTILSGLFLSCLLFASCGDGGGGSGGGLQYTGEKTQAPLDSTNAVDITSTAFQGVNTGSAVNILGFPKNEETVQESSSGSRVFLLSQLMEDSIQKIDFLQATKNKMNPAMTNTSFGEVPIRSEPVSFSQDIPGSCGGSANFNFNIDSQTGDFNGTFTYNDYCDDATTLSGSVTVSGQINVNNTSEFFSLTITISSLTVNSGSDSFTTAGSMEINFSGSSTSLTLDLLLNDTTLDKMFWLNNYTMTSTSGAGFVDISITGRFYHPDHGYVDISTSTPLRINGADDFPSSGIIIAVGSNGTQAQFEALSSTTFRVQADTDGDNVNDFDSGVMNWSDL